MSITKANILTQVRARTGRGSDLVDIDDELAWVLFDLSSRVPGMVQKSSSVTVLAAAVSAALPSDCVAPLAVQTEAGAFLDPVVFNVYLAFANALTVTAATPQRWAPFAGNLYVHPAPTAEVDLTLHHTYDEDDVDSIGLPDVAELACIEGTCAQVEAGLGLVGEPNPDNVGHRALYEQQVAILTERYKHRMA